MVRIMVVDDAMFMRKMLTDILVKHGYEVVCEASDGEEAIKQYMVHKPDLVTMDITMPSMGGISALRKLREVDPDVKVIICSAMGQQSMVLDAIKAGAKDFVVKPFNPERVVETITRVLA